MKAPGMKAPPSHAPPPISKARTACPQPAETSAPSGLPTHPIFNLVQRLEVLEKKIESILEILSIQPAPRSSSCSRVDHARPSNLAPLRQSGEEPVTEHWDWQWRCIPPLTAGQTYHLCYYNNKPGSCEEGTPAAWFVHWSTNHNGSSRFSLMCDFCAKYYREDGKLDGFKQVMPVSP